MKIRISVLATSLLCLCGTAHAVVFDAYKDDLEKGAVCEGYPKLDLSMHLQMLKETGAISVKSVLGSKNKLYTYKATNGFTLYGAPLLSVSMSPGDKNLGPSLAVTVKTQGTKLAQAALDNARKLVRGVAFKQDAPTHFTLNTAYTEPTAFEVTISEDKPGEATLQCGPFAP